MSEETKESAELAPRGAGLGQSVRLTLDAARWKGSPQTYRALGLIQPFNSPRGQRLKATIKYNSAQKHNSTQKITRVTHALL